MIKDKLSLKIDDLKYSTIDQKVINFSTKENHVKKKLVMFDAMRSAFGKDRNFTKATKTRTGLIQLGRAFEN